MSDVTIDGKPPMPPDKAKEIILSEGLKATRKALLLTEGYWKANLIPGVRGYRTGHYARSITSEAHREGDRIVGAVGSNLPYARYLEHGTGLHGPLHHWIVPHPPHRFMRWPEPGNPAFTLAGRQRSGRAGRGARWVFARRTRGMMARHYGRDAALKARPFAERFFREAGEAAARRIAKG